MWQVAQLQLSTVGIQICICLSGGRQNSELFCLGDCVWVSVFVWGAGLTPKMPSCSPDCCLLRAVEVRPLSFCVSYLSLFVSASLRLLLFLHFKTISLWSTASLSQRRDMECVNTLKAEDNLSFFFQNVSNKKKESKNRQQLVMIEAPLLFVMSILDG